jgi:hypothetical protein
LSSNATDSGDGVAEKQQIFAIYIMSIRSHHRYTIEKLQAELHVIAALPQ